MLGCLLSLFISFFGLFLGPNKVVVKECADLLEMKPGITYVIKRNIDLNGKGITIPDGCELVFKRGSLENGEICFQNTRISGKGVLFCDVKVSGTVRNEKLYASWFTNIETSSDDYLVDVIKFVCDNNASFVFSNREYSFFQPIFIYGKCNLIGSPKTIIRSYENGKGIFILAGNSGVGAKPITWEGTIQGIHFIAQTGKYNYFLGLLNVQNCEVFNCVFDLSNEGVDCSNKVIASVNNGNYANPSKGNNISIRNNTIIIQSSEENRNNCEPIGVESRTNVTIMDNIVWNARDDLGVHNCSSIEIKRNTIYAYDGRIYVSNSTDINVEDNRIEYVFSKVNGMGIYIGVETGYDQIPERIRIKSNTIDYSRGAQVPCYGIRIVGARDVVVEKNDIKGNPQSRISVEPVMAKESQDGDLFNPGFLIPRSISIRQNHMCGLWITGLNGYVVSDFEVTDNLVEKEISISNNAIVFRGNTIRPSARVYSAPTMHLNVIK